MKTRMKSKRGKAIIGIAMAAIMVASVMVAMVPTATAVAPGVTVDPETQGTTVNVPVDYTFTITNNDVFWQTFTVTYPALTGDWTGAPLTGFTTVNVAPGGTVPYTLTLNPVNVPPAAVNDPPINVPVTVRADGTVLLDTTTKTIGCYITPLTYNGLENVINADLAGTLVAAATRTAVIIGQDLFIRDNTVVPPVPLANVLIEGDPTSSATAGQTFFTDGAGKFDSAAMTIEGTYYIAPSPDGTSIAPPTTCRGVLAVTDPTMTLDLRVSGTSVSSITQGTPLQIRFTNNIDQDDMVTLKIVDPDGDQIKSTPAPAQKFSKVNVRLIRDVYGVAGIDTTGWSVGTYTFQVGTAKTVADNIGARGLDASSNEKTLTIGKAVIAISAEKTEVAEDQSVRLTVTGVTGHAVTIDSSDWVNTLFPGGLDNNPAADTTVIFADTIDADGKRTYCVEFSDTGAYEITVRDTNTGDEDSVDITVREKAVTFDIPGTIYIGEKITVKGTANTGDTVAIAFDNVIANQAWSSVTIGADDEFSKDIQTGVNSPSTKLKSPGSVRIKAFVNWALPAGGVYPFTIAAPDDGSSAILLATGKLKAEISTKSVATGDDFTVSGSAEGPRFVDIFTVAPKGSGGDGLVAGGITWWVPIGLGYWTDYPGCTANNVAVSQTDDTYSKKLDVQGNADTGTYLVAVLSRGIDGQYGDNQGATLQAAVGAYAGDISTKTQDQVLSILEGLTTRPGSDDLMWVGYVKVETPYVRLDPIESVAVGEPLKVTGESNRADGFTIVVTCKNGKELDPETVSVTNGTFEATFDTTGTPVGTYTVKADDGDGHTDDATVDISEKAKPTPPPTPTATAKPTATPVPTVAPTATPEPTPTKTPGFGAVFAIAGMLAIAYLVLRKRRE